MTQGYQDNSETTSRSIHGACVSIGSSGAILMGESGAGKSDLAYRFIMDQRIQEERFLVADDRIYLEPGKKHLMAKAPLSIQGKIELRGVGIVSMPFRQYASVRLVVELAETRDQEPRMQVPFEEKDLLDFHGSFIPRAILYPFDCSSPLKLAQLLVEASRL